MSTNKPEASSRVKTPRRVAANRKWSEEKLLTSDKSVLIDMDLVVHLNCPSAAIIRSQANRLFPLRNCWHILKHGTALRNAKSARSLLYCLRISTQKRKQSPITRAQRYPQYLTTLFDIPTTGVMVCDNFSLISETAAMTPNG